MTDFDALTPFADFDTGKHLKQETVASQFKPGNIFVSLRLLRSQRTSRRDDLDALAYMLIYILNGMKMPELNIPQQAY